MARKSRPPRNPRPSLNAGPLRAAACTAADFRRCRNGDDDRLCRRPIGTTATKLLLGWDIGVVLYLALVYQLMVTCGIDGFARRAAEDDEGALALLILTGLSGLAIMGAIIAELGIAKIASSRRASWFGISIAMVTILVSWAFVHTIFALHYAHEYYGARGDHAIGGLTFPGRQPPDYWDFLYFSLVIAMTSQVSDVVITSKVIPRRIVTVHGAPVVLFQTSRCLP